jgi:hypothetical protein
MPGDGSMQEGLVVAQASDIPPRTLLQISVDLRQRNDRWFCDQLPGRFTPIAIAVATSRSHSIGLTTSFSPVINAILFVLPTGPHTSQIPAYASMALPWRIPQRHSRGGEAGRGYRPLAARVGLALFLPMYGGEPLQSLPSW